MNKTYSVGLIGLDTSHAVAFTRLLNDPESEFHVCGGKVTTAYAGGSPDVEMSISRVDGFTATLRDDFGVTLCDSPEAVADACDLVFIETIDGRIHRQLFERIAPFGKPTFIDKPFTIDPDEAKVILELAAGSAVPVMSCSALRYADNLQAALNDDAAGGISGCDTFGPMNILEPFEGLYWYGVHMAEMLVTALGAGCRRVQAYKNANHDVIACEWDDGRMGVIHGLREQHKQFGITLHRRDGMTFHNISANQRPYYASLLDAIFRSLPEGRSDIPESEMLEVIRIMDAANSSRRTGAAVELRPVK